MHLPVFTIRNVSILLLTGSAVALYLLIRPLLSGQVVVQEYVIRSENESKQIPEGTTHVLLGCNVTSTIRDNLKKCSTLNQLTITVKSTSSEFERIVSLTTVKQLELFGLEPVKSATFELLKTRNLESLAIHDYAIQATDIGTLTAIPSLNSVSLYHVDIDLDGVKRLAQCQNVKHIHLAGLKHLDSTELSKAVLLHKEIEVFALTGLPTTESALLSIVPGESNLKGLIITSGSTSLAKASLDKLVVNASKLEHLTVCIKSSEALSALAECKNLQSIVVSLSEECLASECLKALTKVKKLEEVTLIGAQPPSAKDIEEFVEQCPQIKAVFMYFEKDLDKEAQFKRVITFDSSKESRKSLRKALELEK
ncbi:MAG: hypothetical protein IT462_05365 [Planctomycetes bacterium]|nr:hypothetical protein [Planctomycetota bacterium]